jgi:hypothetical protein
MNRRDVFPILGVVAATSAPPAADAAPTDYKPRALTTREYEAVTALANLILPADKTSAGAGDAGAALYIDTVLFHAPKASLEEFRTGLKPLAALRSKRAMDGALAKLDAAKDPFFRRLKLMVIDAYCLSPEARKFLQYTGDSAVDGFPGCNHPEHQKL